MTYNFSAIVETIRGADSIRFNAKLGDTLRGSFSYHTNSIDANDDNINQGYYHQAEPATVNFTLNDFEFNATRFLNSYPPNMTICVQNNDTQYVPTNDHIDWTVGDSVAAEKYHSKTTALLSGFFLADSTATVFVDDKLPKELHFKDFTNTNMNIYAIDYSNPQIAKEIWQINLRIYELK